MLISDFIHSFKHYFLEMAPALLIGFFISGVIHEFIPTHWVNKHLGGKGIKGVLYSTLVGTIVPVCCWGSLPIALSFYKRGASLGAVLAILIATPATSINALIVTARMLGLRFAVYIFFAVIFMGVFVGIIGNMIKIKRPKPEDIKCECDDCSTVLGEHKKGRARFFQRLKPLFKFAYIEMPKEIGVETLIGLSLAAAVSVIVPVGALIKDYLSGNAGYIFSLLFGIVMYMCATMSVPLVDAFIKQGMTVGAGLTLLLIGPITSYATILVLRKEFGIRLLAIYLFLICAVSLGLGYLYSVIW